MGGGADCREIKREHRTGKGERQKPQMAGVRFMVLDRGTAKRRAQGAGGLPWNPFGLSIRPFSHVAGL